MSGNSSTRPPTQSWLWVFILVLAYICSYVDRQILSLMVDPIRADLDISDSQFGLLHGFSFAMLYCILGIPIGSLVDRKSRRHIIASGIVVWSLMTALCGLTTKFWQLFLARVGVGVGEAALSPAAYSLLSDSFPKERLGLALSVYTAGAGIGAGLAYIMGGAIYAVIDGWGEVRIPGLGEMATWQTVFLFVALPGLPVALLVWLLTEPERTGRINKVAPPITHLLRFIADQRGFMTCFLLGMSAITGATMALMAWSPSVLIRVYGMSHADAGLYLGIVTMIAFPGGLLSGSYFARLAADRGRARADVWIAALASGMTVCASVALILGEQFFLVLTAIGVVMYFTTMPFGIAGAYLQSITPNEMRGRMSAIYLFTVNFFGMTLGPLLPGLYTDYVLNGDGEQINYSLGVTGLILGLCAAVLLFLASRIPLLDGQTR